MKTGIELMADERARQISAEGWTPEHDDRHIWGELVSAAICYATAGDNLANAKNCTGDHDTPESLKREILDHDFGIGVSWPLDEPWLKIGGGTQARVRAVA